MGLNIKSFQDTLTSMVDWVATNSNRLVDFSEGSVIRTFLESISAELEEYYFKTYKNIIWAMENSVYEAFGFTLLSAVPAYGTITLSFSSATPSDMTIASGAQFSSPYLIQQGIYFSTQQAYTVPAGSVSADITVYCNTSGTVGNVTANQLTVMINPISYVQNITNQGRFLTGQDEETLSARKKRFADYVDTRSKGTAAALAYGAKEVQQITGVYVDDQIGMVNIYCHDAYGNLSDTLRQQVQDNLFNYKAGGIPVFVLPIVKTNVDVNVTLTVLPAQNNFNFQTTVQNQIEAYFDNFVVAQDYLSSDLNAFIRGVDPLNIVNCRINTPVSDMTANNNELLRSGTISVNLVTQ